MSRRRYSDEDYLSFDFSADDKDDSGIRCVSTKLVTTRIEHTCLATADTHVIPAGSRARVEKGIFDNRWCSWYSCLDCIDDYLDEWG